MKINVMVEIPKNSKIKYEYDRQTKQILVDRILYGPYTYPMNYGFIPEALDYDGDELDALIIADQAFIPGCMVKVRVIGAMEMNDDGETDTKLITVVDSDPRYDYLQTIDDVPKHRLLELKDFFENYKNLEKKSVVIKGFHGLDWAIKEYNECVALMNKYKDTDKKAFVAEMRQQRPHKYQV